MLLHGVGGMGEMSCNVHSQPDFGMGWQTRTLWSLLNVCVFGVSVDDIIWRTFVRDPVDRLLLTSCRHLILLSECSSLVFCDIFQLYQPSLGG